MLLKCRKCVTVTDTVYHYFRGNPGASTMIFSRKAFESSVEALRILIDKFPKEYAAYAEACKGQNLFSALRVPEMSREEFIKMYDKRTRRAVIFNRHLSVIKRMILGIALISYHLARFSCRTLTFIAQKMQVK